MFVLDLMNVIVRMRCITRIAFSTVLQSVFFDSEYKYILQF